MIRSINHESYDVDVDDYIASYDQSPDDIGDSMNVSGIFTETLGANGICTANTPPVGRRTL
jgi:hypothetical protein